MASFGTRTLFVLGDCPTGLDAHARHIAKKNGYDYHVEYADWDRIGRGAGNVRNQQMVDYAIEVADLRPESPLLLLSFPTETSVGTWDCVRRGRRAGIRSEDVTELLNHPEVPDWAGMPRFRQKQQSLL
jgi:hypothetical protein